jgi:hypothetical protein
MKSEDPVLSLRRLLPNCRLSEPVVPVQRSVMYRTSWCKWLPIDDLEVDGSCRGTAMQAELQLKPSYRSKLE